MGPTASGKTGIAAQLARQFPVELISVDSAQVYRQLNIGAAKPSAEFLAEFPHHLIDIRDPWESYSAGAFCRDVAELIRVINEAGRIPLLVGGTMLYFQALQQGLAELPAADAELRAQLDAQAAAEGWPALHAQLQRLDPHTAERLKPTDAQRIQRALEVCMLTGEPMSGLLATTAPPIEVNYLNIGLLPSDRSVLHERIRTRLAEMIAAGFIDEVRALLKLPGMSADVPAMRAVGYRQFVMYLAGELADDEAHQKALVATRRLAKRQLTWLRGWPELHPVDCLGEDAAKIVAKTLQKWL